LGINSYKLGKNQPISYHGSGQSICHLGNLRQLKDCGKISGKKIAPAVDSVPARLFDDATAAAKSLPALRGKST
jgi:hypothetical protein